MKIPDKRRSTTTTTKAHRRSNSDQPGLKSAVLKASRGTQSNNVIEAGGGYLQQKPQIIETSKDDGGGYLAKDDLSDYVSTDTDDSVDWDALDDTEDTSEDSEDFSVCLKTNTKEYHKNLLIYTKNCRKKRKIKDQRIIHGFFNF